MKFEKFQKKVEELKRYPETQKVVLPVTWLNEESGEVSKELKKSLKFGEPYDLDNFEEEMGDVLLCLANLAVDLDLDLDDIADQAIEKLKQRSAEYDAKSHS